jgi:hypothetical protein
MFSSTASSLILTIAHCAIKETIHITDKLKYRISIFKKFKTKYRNSLFLKRDTALVEKTGVLDRSTDLSEVANKRLEKENIT